jgi:hypothetical protein
MGDPGPSDEVKNQELAVSQAQVKLAQEAEARNSELFKLTEPGLKTAEDYYTKLSTGDPHAIFQAIAPAAEQVATQFNASKQNIADTSPRGGVRDLAMAETDMGKAGQIGRLGSQTFLSSFPALASLAGQGIGLSLGELSNSISAFGGASSTINNLGNQQEAGKAAQMGMFGAMAGGVGQIASAGITKCWIAAAIYGKLDERTLWLRFWLSHVFGARGFGKFVMWVYGKIGRQVAWFVERSSILRLGLRPLFDYALVSSTGGAQWVLR